MSKNRKNFHYHYAEQYETREERRARSRRKARFSVPPLALIFSAVMLIIFGLISTTFSVYVTTSFDDAEMPESGGLVVQVKNKTVRDDLASTGVANSDLADTGASNSDLADVGADVDLTSTGAFSNKYGSVTVYFKNTASWSSVYVYFFSGAPGTNNNSYKVGTNQSYYGQMTKIDSTNNIYA